MYPDLLELYAIFADGTREYLTTTSDDYDEIEQDTPHKLHCYWRAQKRLGRTVLRFEYVRTQSGAFGDTEVPVIIRTPRGKERRAHVGEVLAAAVGSDNPLVSNTAAAFAGFLYKHINE